MKIFRYQERLDKLIHDLELRRKVEVHEVEERKNEHINDLIRNHERQFTKMKVCFSLLSHCSESF